MGGEGGGGRAREGGRESEGRLEQRPTLGWAFFRFSLTKQVAALLADWVPASK